MEHHGDNGVLHHVGKVWAGEKAWITGSSCQHWMNMGK